MPAKCHLLDASYSSRDDSVYLVCIVIRAVMFKEYWTQELYAGSAAVRYVCLLACLQSNLVMNESWW